MAFFGGTLRVCLGEPFVQEIPIINRQLETRRKRSWRHVVAVDSANLRFTKRTRLLAAAIWTMTGSSKSAETMLKKVYGRRLPAGSTCVEDMGRRDARGYPAERVCCSAFKPACPHLCRSMSLGCGLEGRFAALKADKAGISSARAGFSFPLSGFAARYLSPRICTGLHT